MDMMLAVKLVPVEMPNFFLFSAFNVCAVLVMLIMDVFSWLRACLKKEHACNVQACLWMVCFLFCFKNYTSR